MTKLKSYYYETFGNKSYIDLYEDNVTYRPYKGEQLSIDWDEIAYIKDRSGNRIEIYSNDQSKKIPVKYSTTDFLELLKSLCDKLIEVHNTEMNYRSFRPTLTYFLGICFIFILLLIFSIFAAMAGFKILGYLLISVCIGLFVLLLFKPYKLMLEKNRFIIGNKFIKQIVKYSDIKGIEIEIRSSPASSGLIFLCIIVSLSNGKKYDLYRYNNIILLFILLRLKHKTYLKKQGIC